MKTKLTKEEAYLITNEYIQKYHLTANTSMIVDDCVVFYEDFYMVVGSAWVVTVNIPSFIKGETEVITYIIADEKGEVEYVIGVQGETQKFHLQAPNVDEQDEWDLLEDD